MKKTRIMKNVDRKHSMKTFHENIHLVVQNHRGPEVCDLHRPVRGHEDVLRLNVTVHHPVPVEIKKSFHAPHELPPRVLDTEGLHHNPLREQWALIDVFLNKSGHAEMPRIISEKPSVCFFVVLFLNGGGRF